MRIRIIWEGKTKNPGLAALQADYAKRIGRFGEISIEELAVPRGGAARGKKSSIAERRLLEKLRGATKVVLDPRGREWSSEEFAEWLGQQAVHGRNELVFLIGGPDGISQTVREEADLLLSLSRMTLTTDWARALLLEQIYRGFSILRGYPYAR
ncbi:MAG: 23S rRNA (pseudouridine(1915)-N(3))-methyltransferase RlmH [Acidobacteria bacterium]|nr:23S rRNA (pseudouridine(1915)-N(3))-methyltransferase RlmH [Acidobacteriota bacterium]